MAGLDKDVKFLCMKMDLIFSAKIRYIIIEIRLYDFNGAK